MNTLHGFSQSIENEDQPDIQIIARPLQDSILLRWAPADYQAWDMGNRFGYKVQRYTILRDSLFLPEPELAEMHTGALLPLPVEKWEALIGVRYAMIAAQAIYGESFIVDAGEGFSPEQAFSLADEQQQRFSFALYAADMSPTVARASALWFTDTRVRENEKYLYRVSLNLPDSLKHLNDTAFVFVGTDDWQPLPAPFDFSMEFGDRLAFLSWNVFVHDQIYGAWLIERSDNNGRTFSPLTRDPYIPISPGEGFLSEIAMKVDTLPANNREYHYRIRGVTIFGEEGPHSGVMKGMGVQEILSAPAIIRYELVKGAVVLHWDFPVEENTHIKEFRVLRAFSHKSDYQVLEQNIQAGVRRFTDANPMETAYYKVVAWRDDFEKHSFPFLVQQTDSIPPEKPTGLMGIADSLGIVYLSWTPNRDADIYGYRVFRSASGKDEFSQLTNEPVRDNTFQDTISMKDLNASVFYKIFAVDQRQNRSVFSEVLKITKPDLIPPSAPVFKNFSVTSRGIELAWHNSSSHDAAMHQLYRKLKDTDQWELLAEFQRKGNEREGTYIDAEMQEQGIVSYILRAKDNAGNLSEPAKSPELMHPGITDPAAILLTRKSADSGKGEIVLGWTLPKREIKYVRIYRETKENSYTLFETLPGNAELFRDYGLRIGNQYKYRIQLVYMNGEISGFSNEVLFNL